MTSYQLFAAMPSALAVEIIEFLAAHEKAIYQSTFAAVVAARKVRPAFLERMPRAERVAALVASLGRAGLAADADIALRAWLLHGQTALLTDFLDALAVSHVNGQTRQLPASVPEATLHAALESLLASHRPEVVAVYLHAFNHMNETRWTNLDEHVMTDPRLELKRGA